MTSKKSNKPVIDETGYFEEKITVCSNCFTASCWQGVFPCDKYKTASATDRMRAKARRMGAREVHPFETVEKAWWNKNG